MCLSTVSQDAVPGHPDTPAPGNATGSLVLSVQIGVAAVTAGRAVLEEGLARHLQLLELAPPLRERQRRAQVPSRRHLCPSLGVDGVRLQSLARALAQIIVSSHRPC